MMQRRHLRQDREAVCSRPTLVGVGKVGAKIAEPCGAEHGVRHCVCHDVGITVTLQARSASKRTPPNTSGLSRSGPVAKAVLVEADPYP